ncbi:MAG: hypothetical protein D6814_10760 [Calditrichaeota bacterium]|nr:MAG: hypothetical protein D6814_10760 [Calditrichota bacterium]
MQRSFSIMAMVYVLIFSILAIQTVPSLAETKDKPKKVTVAFLGIHYEKVPRDVRTRIDARIRDLLKNENGFNFIPPDAVQQKVGANALQKLLTNDADLSQYLTLAEQLDADYLFSGNLANQSRDPNRILLVGELHRADRKAGILNRFEVLKYYDQFGVELIKFQNEYIKTIVPVVQQKKTLWPWLVVAGVAVAGLISLTLSSSKAKSEGTPAGTEPVKP